MEDTKKAILRAGILLINKLVELVEDEDLFSPEEKLILMEGVEALEEEEKSIQDVPSESITKIITTLLKQLGVPAHIKGYRYLRMAIEMTVNDPSLLNAITKELYPRVAKAYNTTPQRVERGMRHAIDRSWNIGQIELINELFGYSVSEGKKPTNGNFIAALVDYIRMQQLS